MKYKASLLIALATTMANAADGDVRVIPGTVTQRLIEASSDNGPTSLTVRDEEVEFEIKGDPPLYSRLVIMFNAPSHRYCWTLPAAGRRRDQGPPRDWPSLYSAAFITTKGVVLYYASDPAALLVQECKGEALNLDDAGRRALDEIKAHLDDTRFGKQSHRVGLGLPREFSSPPGFSMYYLTVLRNVVHDGDKWRLTLKNRWTVEVLLDANYHLIETNRVHALLPYH